MDEHDRGGVCAIPAVGWVHLGVDSFAVVGVDVSFVWLHGRWEREEPWVRIADILILGG